MPQPVSDALQAPEAGISLSEANTPPIPEKTAKRRQQVREAVQRFRARQKAASLSAVG